MLDAQRQHQALVTDLHALCNPGGAVELGLGAVRTSPH